MDKEFVIGMVFEKIDTKKISGKANDFPTQPEGDYNIPLLTAGIENQGLARYAMRSQCPTILSNVISVSANGANSGVVFYHPEEFAVLQDAYAIQVRNYEIPNSEVGLYLTSALYKAVASTHDWNYKAGWNRIKEDKFTLPIKVDENGNPIIDDTHFYHEEGFVPDFDYMQERIEELEQERIEELEQYLVATGLNDYELTDEDIETLSLSGFGHYEERDSEDAVKVCKEFKVSDLFTKKTMKGYPKKDENLEENPNGYYVYGQNIQRQHPQKVLLDAKYLHIVSEDNPILAYTSSVGEIGMICEPFYRSGDNGAFQGLFSKHHQFNKYELQFILSILRKYFDNFGYTTGMAHIMDLTFPLPIQTDAKSNPIIDTECKYHPDGYIPDWNFMEKYIKAIEKIVIADVVQYKDAMISKTKEVVA